MSLHKKIITLFLLVVFAVSLGCAATSTRESTGEYLDDSVITAKIKGLLVKDLTLKSFAISVETFRGVVILSGFVDSNDQIDRAIQIARGVKGVREVKSQLMLKPKS
ncbi:MAG TPA: BON domain-containing protein [Proteobacteria bacterium]|nr:BON domain-containing protein [Pseudomonadota bacterium]